MDVKAILIWVAIGIIAGWLASVVVGGGGLIRYLVSGLIGAFVGGFLFKLAGINVMIWAMPTSMKLSWRPLEQLSLCCLRD